MKEIVCLEKSIISILQIGCVFLSLIVLISGLIYNRYIDIGFFMVLFILAIYLVYLILCHINIHIKINENGIEYKNFLNVRKKYSWNEIVVDRDRNRGAAIVFNISGKKIRVYSYYRNYHLLNEWLKKLENIISYNAETLVMHKKRVGKIEEGDKSE